MKKKISNKLAKYSDKEFNDIFGFLQEPVYEEQDSGILLPANYDSDDFDIFKIMNDGIDPITGVVRNLKIDDRDFKLAKNYYDYTINILGSCQNTPWLIQMWTMLMAFGEVCTICSDKRWLDIDYVVEKVDKKFPAEGIKDHLILLNNGICSKCKTPKRVLIEKHGLNDYDQLTNLLGQRSGKSAGAASGASYVNHCYIKFPRYAELEPTHVQKSMVLSGTFVANTFSRTISLIWTPFQNIIKGSRWWQDYHKFLDYHGEKYGMELYRHRDLALAYYYKNLFWYPTHPGSKTLRGDTRIYSVIDELGMFPVPDNKEEDNFGEDEGNKKANADEVHKSLMNSFLTVHLARASLISKGFNPPPLIHMNVSSPYHVRDKMMRLLEHSRTPEGRKTHLGIQLATWEANPHITRKSPYIVNKFAENPITAMRDFGAQPSLNASPFLTPKTVSFDLFTGQNTHKIHYLYDNPGYISAKVEQLHPVTLPSLLVVDAGSVNNSFAIGGVSYDPDTYKTIWHTFLEIRPHDKREIDFNSIYLNVILPVAKNINAVAMLADRWQAIDHLHRIKDDMGNRPDGKPICMSKQYSPRRKDFDTATTLMDNKSVTYPKISQEAYDDMKVGKEVGKYMTSANPTEHLVLQMLTVRDIGRKSPPMKGDGFTDDLYRIVVLGTRIHDPAIMTRIQEAIQLGLSKGGLQSPSPIIGSRGFSMGRRW